ncbi:hypothetical protein D3C79_662810 [compost metagenome]
MHCTDSDLVCPFSSVQAQCLACLGDGAALGPEWRYHPNDLVKRFLRVALLQLICMGVKPRSNGLRLEQVLAAAMAVLLTQAVDMEVAKAR